VPSSEAPSPAHALLMGTARHQATSGLEDVPSVTTTLAAISDVLVRRCGLEAKAVHLVLDPPGPVEMGAAVSKVAETANGLLIFYFVGHGLVSSRGDLYLAAAGTDSRPGWMEFTALEYAKVRHRLLESSARPPVVILDCCFSGQALSTLSPADEIVQLAAVSGGFVITSAGREELALAPPGEPYTAFSGALKDYLEQGRPDGPQFITLQDVYQHLSRVLPMSGYPRPRYQSSGEASRLVLARNPAFKPCTTGLAGMSSAVETMTTIKPAATARLDTGSAAHTHAKPPDEETSPPEGTWLAALVVLGALLLLVAGVVILFTLGVTSVVAMLLVTGAVAGFGARLLTPGIDPMGIVGTVVLGIVGSLVGGFLGYVLFGKDPAGGFQPAFVLGAIIGAVVALQTSRVAKRLRHR
jgi:uncharacterized membrane protein YeaQ/YmgE (transglycosylase-associated protein family)